MKTTKQILQDARKLISDPSNWTKESNARDRSGLVVWFDDAKAVCWCANGAIRLQLKDRYNKDDYLKAVEAMTDAAIELYGIGMINVNDILGHQQILNVFDLAIKRQGE